MNSFIGTARRSVSCALLFVASAAAVGAQEPLPAAEDILARYHEAIGGRQAFVARTSMHSVGAFAITAAGLSGQVEVWSARPNRTAMRVDLPGFGELRTGYTGAVGWSLSAMEGPRLLEGAEAAQAAEDADFDSHLRTRRLVAAMTTVEQTTLGGHECYKVKLVWQSGRESFDCYSLETGLLVGSLQQRETNMGSVEAVLIYEEYREFGGVRLPTRIITQLLGLEQVITLTDVHFDVVSDATFEPPPEIRTLIGK